MINSIKKENKKLYASLVLFWVDDDWVPKLSSIFKISISKCEAKKAFFL
jgi:hypothetical protein